MGTNGDQFQTRGLLLPSSAAATDRHTHRDRETDRQAQLKQYSFVSISGSLIIIVLPV